MVLKGIATACVASALILSPLQTAAGDGLVGGLVGGIIGGAIANGAFSGQRRTTRSSGVSSATREANREVQNSLNFFGYPVGTPDGALGPRSRGAISQFQATMGFGATGRLNEFERDILVQSWYRAQAGGALTARKAATDPRGTRAILFEYRDEKLGIVPQGGQMVMAPVAPAPQAGFAAAPVVAVPEPASPPATALPSFLVGQGASQASLASHCNKVSLITNSNGGFVTQVSMTDPAFALSEQFCLARTYAIAQGEELAAKIPGFTPQQIAQQCEGLGPLLKDHVTALSLKSREEVVQGVSGFVLTSGMAPAQLAATAKICLGVGYVTDNMDVAIGSALILAVVGEKAYAELPGHHLIAGIGAAPRSDLALPWFDMSYDATQGGAAQVFAPGMTDRNALIRLAAYSSAGRALPGAAVPGTPVPAAMPSFQIPGAVTSNP